MLSEKGYQGREILDNTPSSLETPQIETAIYIGNMTSELQMMARKSGLVLLAYLLSMAALHARDVAGKSNEMAGEAGKVHARG